VIVRDVCLCSVESDSVIVRDVCLCSVSQVELHGPQARVCGAAADPDGAQLLQGHDGSALPPRLQVPHQGHRDTHRCKHTVIPILKYFTYQLTTLTEAHLSSYNNVCL